MIDRAAAAAALGVPADLGHDYVEVAIDLLLDQQYPEYDLGRIISAAASARSSQIPDLLARCYRDVPGSSGPAVRTVEADLPRRSRDLRDLARAADGHR